MKSAFTYIFIFLLMFTSCSLSELNNLEHGNIRGIEFAVRQTSFISYDVSTASTKAIESDGLIEVEKTIYSAYFMVYDSNGNRVMFEPAISNNTIQSKTLRADYGTSQVTVCFIANVPYSYAASLDTKIKLLSSPLPVSYDFSQGQETYGYLGCVPKLLLDINGDGTDETDTYCIPMFGMGEYSLSDSNIGNLVTIPLRRLFAKVYINLKMNLSTAPTKEGTAAFQMDSYTIRNLPSNVLLADAFPEGKSGVTKAADITESPWVANANVVSDVRYFEETTTFSLPEPYMISNGGSSVFKLTCYVPEYALKPKDRDKFLGIEITPEPQDRPTRFNSSKRPICLTFDGVARHPDYIEIPLGYEVFLGEDAIDSFSLCRDYKYYNNLTIKGIDGTLSGDDSRVEIEVNLADPEFTGVEDPANCYIVSKPGRYKIPTYEGNNIAGGTKGNIALLVNGNQNYDIHSDGHANTLSDFEFETDSDGKNWVKFNVNKSVDSNDNTTSAAVTNGNTVLIFKKSDGSVVWSWHLWFCEDEASTELYNTNATMMNRNIGASVAEGQGMYYLWGDKDPYFSANSTASYYGGTSEGSWTGQAKSATDPCPPGYRVPTVSVWNNGKNALTTFGTDYFTYEGSPRVLYPYSGYIDTEGVHQGSIETTVDSQTLEEEIAATYEVPKAGQEAYQLYNPRRYKNIVFRYDNKLKSGLLHGTDGHLFYGYEKVASTNILEILLNGGYEIISCQRQVGSLVEGTHYTTSGRWVTKYTYTGEVSWPTNNEWDTLDANWFNSGSGLSALARQAELTNLKNELSNYLESKNIVVDIEAYERSLTINTEEGYQVRCVSETSQQK